MSAPGVDESLQVVKKRKTKAVSGPEYVSSSEFSVHFSTFLVVMKAKPKSAVWADFYRGNASDARFGINTTACRHCRRVQYSTEPNTTSMADHLTNCKAFVATREPVPALKQASPFSVMRKVSHIEFARAVFASDGTHFVTFFMLISTNLIVGVAGSEESGSGTDQTS
jgi:hypothetical protein